MKDWIYQHIGKDSIFYHFRYFSEDEGPSILEGLASAGTQRILNKFPILKFLTNKNSISKIYLPLWNLFKKIKWTLNGFSFAFTIHILSKKLSKLSILIYSIHWITQKNHFRTFIEKFDFSYKETLNRLIPSEKACCQIKFRYLSKVCAHTEN